MAGTPESAGPAALSPSKAPLSQDLEAPSSVQALSGSASQGAPLPWEDAAHKDKQAASAELAGLVGRLRAASGDQDYEAVDGVRARLAAFVGGDPERAAALAEAFANETDPELLAVIAGVLSADPAATMSDDIVRRLALLASASTSSAAQREHALLFLGQAQATPPELFGILAALANDANDPVLQQGALGALVSRANQDVVQREQAVPELVRALSRVADPELRGALLMGVPLEDASPALVSSVADTLARDASDAAREAAAHALGSAAGPARDGAVEALSEAVRSDPSPAAKRAALASLVRLLGAGAADPMQQVRPEAGEAAIDVDDYLSIIAAGETQADRIYRLKLARENARGISRDAHVHED
ncbi:MAG: hypothetical protein ACYTFT_04735 [Planctomycetota bacterium]